MQTFTAATATAPDPAKHVKYSPGMVLGVDDFTQEFAFHNGRNEWLLRDVVGYGTTSGLRVSYEETNQKRQVRVTAGSAVSPRGQMIRVCCDQCADLPAWLTSNQEQVTAHLGSPNAGSLAVFVTLCYRECPTDQVPIPGEPCRSETDAMAPSRWKSDFALELRFSAPEQKEEDVLRRMIQWLQKIPVADDSSLGSPSDQAIADVLDAFRLAAKDTFSPSQASTPVSPDEIFVGLPPSFLKIPSALAGEAWSAVFRLWVTELRPEWQARFLNANACCGGDDKKRPPTKDECLLLAKLEVPVQLDSKEGWQLSGLPHVIDERRPLLLHLQLLQEWLLGANSSAALFKSEAVTHPSSSGGYSIVAAGRVRGSADPGTVTGLGTALPYNGLRVLNGASAGAGIVQVTFDTYKSPVAGENQYLVKVLPGLPGPGAAAAAITVMFRDFAMSFFELTVADQAGTPIPQSDLANMEFMIEVSEFPG